VFEVIVQAAAAESPLWGEALRPEDQQVREPVFSMLAPPAHGLGLETIYEGYLVHYGRSRLFEPPDRDTALLLGDYLYAHGLVRIADTGDVKAVADLAELISRCAQLRAEGLDGDGREWVATSSALGEGGQASANEHAVDTALAVHARFVGRSDAAAKQPPSGSSARPETPR
jgi:hypothetical protein